MKLPVWIAALALLLPSLSWAGIRSHADGCASAIACSAGLDTEMCLQVDTQAVYICDAATTTWVEIGGGSGTLTEDQVEAFIFDADAETVTGVWTWNDSIAATFGTGGDATILWDGSALLINPQIVTSGHTDFTGAIRVSHDETEYSLFGPDPTEQNFSNGPDNLNAVSARTVAGGSKRAGNFVIEILNNGADNGSQSYGLNAFVLTGEEGSFASTRETGPGAGAAGRYAFRHKGEGLIVKGGAVSAQTQITGGTEDGTMTNAYSYLDEGGDGGANTGITTYRSVWIKNGSGSIATKIGVDIEDLTVGTDTSIGIRIAGAELYGLQLSSTAADPEDGIWWATDTNLYRSAADTLKTDDALVVTGALTQQGFTVLDTDDIGGTVQAWDAELDTIRALTETNGNVMFVAGGVWTSDATPAIDCSDCTSIPAGAHTGTIAWGGTSILESGTAFQFGDGSDGTVTHTYGVTTTDPVVAYSSAVINWTTGELQQGGSPVLLDSDLGGSVQAIVTEGSLADQTIVTADIKEGTILVGDMAANSIDSDQYVDNSIDNAHMADNSINSDDYVDGSIDLIHMSTDSVDSDNIVANTIVAADVAASLDTRTAFHILRTSPVVADEWHLSLPSYAGTMTNFVCECVGGTSITVDLCDGKDTGDDTCTTSVLGSPLACLTSGKTEDSSLTNAGFAADDTVTLVVTADSGSPSQCYFKMTATVD